MSSVDVAATCTPKSDQLNADDLIGGPMTIRINRVAGSSNKEQPIDIFFDGDSGKPYKPCKSMRRVMVQLWGRDGNAYVGRSMTLFRDERVRFGGVEVGGIRISHMSDLPGESTMVLTESKAKRKPYTVYPLATDEQPLPIDDAVRAAGDEAASKGVEAYTEWLGSLEPEVKATVKPLHSGWSKIAKAVVPEVSDDIEPTNEQEEN